jgi:formylglycine-generating enzyme required for sulfatase activity
MIVKKSTFWCLAVTSGLPGTFGCSRSADQPLTPAPAEEVVEAESREVAPVAAKPPALAIAPFDTKLARTHQEAWAEYLGKPVEMTNSIGMKLRLIPPGEFVMGSSREEIDRVILEFPPAERSFLRPFLEVELPQHRVRITRPFYLGMYEVTQEEYVAVMGTNPSWFSRSGGGSERVSDLDTSRFPVEMVSWENCQEFMRRLNGRPEEPDGVYRLPTEAEWEYACRAGTRTRYCFGDDDSMLGEYAWCGSRSDSRTRPVGGKTPNAWGLFDMHGNVWEWCADRFDRRYYANSPVDDPTGPASGMARVNRGGASNTYAGLCRAATRFWNGPDSKNNSLGFRVAWSPMDAQPGE